MAGGLSHEILNFTDKIKEDDIRDSIPLTCWQYNYKLNCWDIVLMNDLKYNLTADWLFNYSNFR